MLEELAVYILKLPCFMTLRCCFGNTPIQESLANPCGGAFETGAEVEEGVPAVASELLGPVTGSLLGSITGSGSTTGVGLAIVFGGWT